ncbi:type V CRISPR-associated protein Cas12k [Spirulina major]|uniref:type V CRISPR-associated protein Cas12k n=1 Tax=Spirulina major TaxID=270636 RepID=UPI0009330B3C|nr:type V CRISPR-associated protein Cas12k [Spirulina major]
MSQITIQCRLVASEATRQVLWTLMAERNTPLINELLAQMAQHPDLEEWRQKGKPTPGVVKKLCDPLRQDPRFMGQPGRFYSSAIALVEYIYKSWLKLQQRLQRKLEGQQRWLGMLKSDPELCEENHCTLDTLRDKAAEILASLESPQPKQGKVKTKKAKAQSSPRQSLFEMHDGAEDGFVKSAIAYLLKNGGKLPTHEEDPKKFAKRRRKAEVKVERLIHQITASLPKGRDLTGERWLETLLTASYTAPKDAQQTKVWQSILLTKTKAVPYPINYETNEDLTWSKNEKGRLCVRFNGLSEHTFQIYCDQRQLKWFQRFYEDQEVKRTSKNQHSTSLFTLRSGRIVWQESDRNDKPWTANHITLCCTLDTRLWSAEGTEEVRTEKAIDIAKTLTNMNEKGDLNDKQQAFIKRKTATLDRINNPYPRPSKPLYHGQSHILVGVALGLDKPATVAVVDGTTGKAITYRNLKQLLGENYKLVNRQRQQKQAQSHQRHKAQKRSGTDQFGDSELGQHIDRLLAKAIVAFAHSQSAGSIVVPKLEDIREIVQSEIQARAEEKVPGYIEGQKQYAKRYRVQVHQWSYGRLIDSIKSKATQQQVVIEEGKQPVRGSPEAQATELAISTYHLRASS